MRIAVVKSTLMLTSLQQIPKIWGMQKNSANGVAPSALAGYL